MYMNINEYCIGVGHASRSPWFSITMMREKSNASIGSTFFQPTFGFVSGPLLLASSLKHFTDSFLFGYYLENMSSYMSDYTAMLADSLCAGSSRRLIAGWWYATTLLLSFLWR
jgi:hypothetical protein